MIVHGRVELLAAAAPERIAERRVAAHPFAQLDDALFGGCEIYKVMPGQNRQYIEIVGKTPAHTVGSYFGIKIRRVDQEHYAGSVFIAIEQRPVVSRLDLQSGKIVRAFGISCLSHVVVERFLAHVLDGQLVFHREHQRRRQCDEIEIA